MELFTKEQAAKKLAISSRTFLRYAFLLNLEKIKRPNDKRLYYTQEGVDKIKEYLDKLHPGVTREIPNQKAA